MSDIEFKNRKGLSTYRLKDFLNERFDVIVRKMPLHSNLGCPNRESGGKQGGCIFCHEPGYSTIYSQSNDIDSQIQTIFKYAHEKGYQGKFMAYFQTGTNTYAEPDVLESLWKPILKYPDQIVALAVGTRPDCLSDEAISILKDIAKKILVWVELGVQSSHDRTLQFINRGHDFECFDNMVKKLAPIHNVYTCAHIILGLPGETKEDMIQTIQTLNTLKIDGVKIHHLQIPKHTQLEALYRKGKTKTKTYTISEYVNLITDLLPYLSPEIAIHRLTGEIKNDLLIAPRWPLPKVRVVQLIEEEMRKKRVFQGKYYKD